MNWKSKFRGSKLKLQCETLLGIKIWQKGIFDPSAYKHAPSNFGIFSISGDGSGIVATLTGSADIDAGARYLQLPTFSPVSG